MAIKAELNYLEFHNTKDKLESGYYRVIEADGDTSIAKVNASPWRGPAGVTWMSEDEYIEMCRIDHELDWSWDHDEFHRARPEDLAEAEYDHNHNSELFDQMVYGIEPDDLTDTEFNRMREQALDSNQHASEAFDRSMGSKKTPSLADLLRAAMEIDPRGMTDEQYAEHCEVAAQNHKDGIHL